MTAVRRGQDGRGRCEGCGNEIGDMTRLTSGRWGLNLSSKWRRDDPPDPMAPRTWRKSENSDLSLAFRRMRARGAQVGPMRQSVRFDDLIVCPKCERMLTAP